MAVRAAGAVQVRRRGRGRCIRSRSESITGGGTLINGATTVRAYVTGARGRLRRRVRRGEAWSTTGVIYGKGGTAVEFKSAADRLVVEAGSFFSGQASAAAGVRWRSPAGTPRSAAWDA